MKQLMMGFAACALLMTSCAEQEIIETVLDGQGQLTFSTGVGKQTTKAPELTNAALQGGATSAELGIKLQTYEESATTPGLYKKWFTDDLWHNGTEWKISSTRFRNTVPTKFVTYYPKSTNLTEVDDAGQSSFLTADFDTKFPAFKYQVNATSENQQDLIAGITNIVANQTDITIGLRHILSQVNFGTVGYNGANIAIQNIQIKNLYNSATYEYGEADTYPIGKWSALGTGGTPRNNTALYPYYNYSNTVDTDPNAVNPQPVVPYTVTKGDIYIFGDGGNAGPGRTTTTWYPIGTNNGWAQAHATNSTGLANSLMLMPQEFVGDADDAKVTFEYKITDKDGAYVAGKANEWAFGEFKLDFTTGDVPGTHYMGRWEQNFRYVYLIDFTDFLDGLALTFDVNVQMYPWENYNKDEENNGNVDIMVAGQPAAAKMNAATFIDGDTWYIASQSETNPTVDPVKWAQVIRNEEWDLRTYKFTQIEKDGRFTFSFLNVIFNTSDKPNAGTDTEIDLLLPDGYTATGGAGITVTPMPDSHYTVKKGNRTATATILITNENEEYSTQNTLGAAITAVATTGDELIYKGTGAITLVGLEPTALTTAGNTMTVKFTNFIIPTLGKSANGTWTWDATTRIATWTRN